MYNDHGLLSMCLCLAMKLPMVKTQCQPFLKSVWNKISDLQG